MQHILFPTQSIRPSIGFWVPANDDVQLEGYQLYAVEKWIVDRSRPVEVLVVYTGDPTHRISLTPFRTSPLLTESEAKLQWEKAIHRLKRDARPKETPHGILMVTSLAHFRSDYTIVQIPGNYLQAKQQLYTNINLLRIGCAGRSALTLEEPTDTTRDKFISAYNLPSSTLTKRNPSQNRQRQETDSQLFSLTVLEFVKLIQAALSVFGFFSAEPDGLLCDDTIEGLRKWVLEIGEGFVSNLESTERVADPTVIAALFSLLLSVRNKLVALGYNNVAPKDPFLHPQLMLSALTAYTHAQSRSVTHSTTSLSSFNPLIPTASTSSTISAHSPAFRHSSLLSFHAPAFLAHHSPHTNSNPSTPGLEVNVTSPTPTTGSHSFFSPFTSPNSTSPAPTSLAYLDQQSTPYLTAALLHMITTSFSLKFGNKTSSYLRGKKTSKGQLGDGSDAELNVDSSEAVSGPSSLITGLALGLSGGATSAHSSIVGSGNSGAATIFDPLTSLEAFINIVVGDKDRRDDDREKKMHKTKSLRKRRDPTSIISLTGLVNLGTSDKEEEPSDRPETNSRKERTKVKDSGTALISGSVAGSIRALWSGRVIIIVRLREKIVERQKAKERLASGQDESNETSLHRHKHRARVSSMDAGGRSMKSSRLGFGGLWSDGDVTDEQLLSTSSRKRADNVSTEEENDYPHGLSPGSISSGTGPRLWGRGKVRGKLESWAGLSKIDSKLTRVKRTSLEASPSASPGELSVGPDLSPISNSSKRISRGTRFSLTSLSSSLAQAERPNVHELLVPPFKSRGHSPANGDNKADVYANEDDDLLSSGQASPVSDAPKPFSLLPSQPVYSSQRKIKNYLLNENDPEYQKKVDEFVRKRPWGNRFTATRVSSWSDPISASQDMESAANRGDDPTDKDHTFTREDGIDGQATKTARSPMSSNDKNEVDGEKVSGRLRRRSFHDLSEFRHIKVLTAERMRIDVELSGQLLIMSRREQHLKNVLATLQVITSRLTSTNSRLREEYQSHLKDLAKVEVKTKAIAEVDSETSKADKISQATQSLWYESEQFNLPSLWHVASSSREKVFGHRDRVFGEGRKLPAGSHGAHGRFNRLQWTLDGREKLVDMLGRTESEAEEESVFEEERQQTALDEEEDAISNQGIKPMWLLRFFTSWISKWGAWSEGKPVAEARNTTSSGQISS